MLVKFWVGQPLEKCGCPKLVSDFQLINKRQVDAAEVGAEGNIEIFHGGYQPLHAVAAGGFVVAKQDRKALLQIGLDLAADLNQLENQRRRRGGVVEQPQEGLVACRQNHSVCHASETSVASASAFPPPPWHGPVM